MKALAAPLIALLMAGALGPALAQAPADAHDSHHPTAPAAAPPQSAQVGQTADQSDLNDLSEGEITRWDPRTLKVTLRHGEIKNLGMPPMTMVFRVKDASLLAGFQPGDKVRFRVEQQNGVYIVTRMETPR